MPAMMRGVGGPENGALKAYQDKKRQEKNAKANERRSKYRQRLQAERQTLKQQAVKLSNELDTIKTARKRESDRQAESLTLSVWKAMAARQLERRLQVEDEQKRLRAAVMARSRLIHRMNTMLLAINQSDDRVASCAKTDASAFIGTQVLKAFMSELDDLHARTDKVMQGVEFKVSSGLAYNFAWKRRKDVDFLEAADLAVLPYTYERTCTALASIMLSAPMEGYELCHDYNVEDPQNTVALKYSMNYQYVSGDSADIVGCVAIRRYEEDDRHIFVWRSLSEGQGDLDGFHAHETSWIVVRPYRVASADGLSECGDPPFTIMELYGRLVPVGVDKMSDSHSRFVELLSRMGEADTKVISQHLERMLLDTA